MSRSGAALLAAICAAVLLASAGPAGANFAPGLNRVAADKGEIYRKGCMMGHQRVRSGACRFGDRRSHHKVVLFGDSHAMQWGPGLIRLAEARGWQVIALTRASCPAALVHIDYYCDAWRRNSLTRIRRMRPGLVVVASSANEEAYEVLADGQQLSRSSSEAWLVDGMIRTLRKLRSWSRRTVVLQDQAVTPFNVTMCLRSNVSTPGHCGFRRSRPLAWAYDYKAARRVRKVPIIDPQPMLCPGGWCHAVDRGILVYRNQGHLSATFTESKYGWLGHKLPDPWAGS
jgi:hypothetical protein